MYVRSLLAFAICSGCPEVDKGGASTNDTDTQDTASGTPITLSNAPTDDSCNMVEIHPWPEEDRNWAAERFEIPGSFVLQEIHYVMNAPYSAAPYCDPTALHTVELYKNSSGSPDATPIAIAGFNVPAGDDASQDRQVVLEVDPPVELEAGDYLYLSIEMRSNEAGTSYLCFQACEHTADTPAAETSWWSQAVDPPYDWATLQSYGYMVTYNAELVGTLR